MDHEVVKGVDLSGRSVDDLMIRRMQAFTNFALQVQLPPNPVRNLDNSLTPAQSRGAAFYSGQRPADVVVETGPADDGELEELAEQELSAHDELAARQDVRPVAIPRFPAGEQRASSP